MKRISLLGLLLFALQAQAKVEVLFHPHDPTLEKIAQWISQANARVDIAMYNMDASDQSPVVKMLKSDAVKERLESGRLKIRLIYEGYGTPAENKKRMEEIEALGIDVKDLGKGVKVHHKFAAIDTGDPAQRLITGSANWSLSSYRNYNENILYFDREPEANFRYQSEFNRLWAASKEFGRSSEDQLIAPSEVQQGDLEVFFNSPRHLKLQSTEENNLTNQVVRLIDGAQARVDIATTRIRIPEVLEAVSRAATRGVQLRIVLSQDDYRDLWKRSQWLFSSPNIQLRVKFYNLKVGEYMTYQMHNKFMIADDNKLLTGSFNWSNSSENNHIENLVELQGAMLNDVLPAYQAEFDMLWNLGRSKFGTFQAELDQVRAQGELPPCSFKPIALEVPEIKKLLKQNPKCASRASGSSSGE